MMAKIKQILEKYNLIFLFGFVLITMQTYVFHELTIHTTLGVIYRAIVVFLIFAYLFLLILSFKIKPSKLFIIISIIYLTSSLISLFVNPHIAKINFSFIQYLASISTIILNIGSIYLFLLTSKIQTKQQRVLLSIVFVSFVFILCFYTYFFQFKNIYESLTNKYGWNYDVTSVFYVKTIYGFFLTVGSIYSAKLYLETKKWPILFIPVFFIGNAIISRNKTSILIISILILYLLVCFLKEEYQKNKRIFYLTIFLLLICILAVSIITATIPNLKRFLHDSIFNDGLVVMNARVEKWSIFFTHYSNLFNVIFGYGERISITILGAYNVSDNIYLLSLSTGGLIKLLMHIFIIAFIYKYALKTKQISQIVLISLIVLSGMFEENYIYGFNLTSLAIAPILYELVYTDETYKHWHLF